MQEKQTITNKQNKQTLSRSEFSIGTTPLFFIYSYKNSSLGSCLLSYLILCNKSKISNSLKLENLVLDLSLRIG